MRIGPRITLAITGLALLLALGPLALRRGRDEPGRSGCGPAVRLLKHRYQATQEYRDVVTLRRTRPGGPRLIAQFRTTFVRQPRPVVELSSLDGKSKISITALNDEDALLKAHSDLIREVRTLSHRRAFARASGFTQGATSIVSRLLMVDDNHRILDENEPCRVTKDGKGTTHYLFPDYRHEVLVGPSGYIDAIRDLDFGEIHQFTERSAR